MSGSGTTRTSGSPRRVIVLGSTGSIGVQTLDVIEQLNRFAEQSEADGARPSQQFEVVGLAAGSRVDVLLEQADAFGVRHIAVADAAALDRVDGARFAQLPGEAPREFFTGPTSAEQLVRAVECDLVVAAVVGVAGLASSLAAVELGRDVAIANKETIVAGGDLVIPAAERAGVRLLPVDSEHSGVWQCVRALEVGPPGVTTSAAGPHTGLAADPRLGETSGPVPYHPPAPPPRGIARVILTASGGPFREATKAELERVTPEQALRHPTWAMGAKNTIDSASLMNKGLELIEARQLFRVPPAGLGVLVHPTSIVHALVETIDGSLIAQLGACDMRVPIQHALTFPQRLARTGDRLALDQLAKLELRELDEDRFGACRLAIRAMELGGSGGAVYNAANEIAGRAFLDHAIPFPRITTLVRDVLEACERAGDITPVRTLDDVEQADATARERARALIS